MINYNEKYLKIKNKLIQKSFPELKGKKIFIGEIWMRKYYSGWACYIPPLKFIGLGKRLRTKNSKIITGVITHELCHFSLIFQRSLLENIFAGISYWFSSKRRKQEEYNTEKLLVQKGYAKEAYASSKDAELVKTHAKIQKYYMSAEQIKKYAKKIGKW